MAVKIILALKTCHLCVGVDSSEWVIIHIKLTKQEQSIIDDGSWLNDKIISASQMLLENELPFIEGFIDAVVPRYLSLNAPAHGDATQCYHIGNHWVVSTSMGGSHVTVYDSLTPTLPHAFRCQLANLYGLFAAGIDGRINVHVRRAQMQIRGSDCGLFATSMQ